MARGRMLSTEASVDPELNGLSQDALILYLLAIPHLDRDGLLDGHPVRLAARCAPLRVEIRDRAAQLIQEWEAAGLVVGYDAAPGKRVLHFKGFRKHNLGIEYTREPASLFSPPPGWTRTKEGMVPADPEECFRLAESFSQRSGYRRALLEAAGEDAPEIDMTSRSPREVFAKSSRLTEENRTEVNSGVVVDKYNPGFGMRGGAGGSALRTSLEQFGDDELRAWCHELGKDRRFQDEFRAPGWAAYVRGMTREQLVVGILWLARWAKDEAALQRVQSVPGLWMYYQKSGEKPALGEMDEFNLCQWQDWQLMRIDADGVEE